MFPLAAECPSALHLPRTLPTLGLFHTFHVHLLVHGGAATSAAFLLCLIKNLLLCRFL